MLDELVGGVWLTMQDFWPHFPLPTDERLRSVKAHDWLDVLGDLDVSAVRAAVLALSDREFPPPPGMIRRRAQELAMTAARLPVAPSWDQAWAEIGVQLRRGMRHRDVEWSHPAVAEAVDTIGKQEFCDTLLDDFPRLRAQFRDVYGRCLARWEQTAFPAGPAVAGLAAGRSRAELGDGRG